MEEKYLAHYGVLGMKWGVRKSNRSSSSRKAAKKEVKALNKESKKLYKEFFTMKNNRDNIKSNIDLNNNLSLTYGIKAETEATKGNYKKALKMLKKGEKYLEKSKMLDKEYDEVQKSMESKNSELQAFLHRVENSKSIADIYYKRDSVYVGKNRYNTTEYDRPKFSTKRSRLPRRRTGKDPSTYRINWY